MSKKTLLADRDKWKDVIAEQQYEFIVWVIESISGIADTELEACFPAGGYPDFTVQHRISLKKLCDAHTIDIVDDKEGGVKIYVNNEVVIAEWKKPWTVLRHDHNQVNPAKRLFMEIHLDWWAIFEDTNEQ